MDWINWCWVPTWIAIAIIVGTITSWALSAWTYDHIRCDIEAWVRELREAHLRQLSHDREERKTEHDHVLYLMDRLLARLQAGQQGNGKKH